MWWLLNQDSPILTILSSSQTLKFWKYLLNLLLKFTNSPVKIIYTRGSKLKLRWAVWSWSTHHTGSSAWPCILVLLQPPWGYATLPQSPCYVQHNPRAACGCSGAVLHMAVALPLRRHCTMPSSTPQDLWDSWAAAGAGWHDSTGHTFDTPELHL